jgi:organic radical activating enzyme
MVRFENIDLDIAGCNWKCSACNHYSPFSSMTPMSVAEVDLDLRGLKQVAHATRMTVIGGEPTTNIWCTDILQVVKESGVCDVVQLSTNGSLLHKMSDRFWQALRGQRMQLTLYPKSIGDNLGLAIRKCHENDILLLTPTNRFFKSLVSRDRTEAEALKNYQECPYRVECWSLYHSYLYRCAAGPKVPGRFMGLHPQADGLLIWDGLTEEKLKEFVAQAYPTHSCYRCDYHKEYIAWHESDNADDWKNDSTRSLGG